MTGLTTKAGVCVWCSKPFCWITDLLIKACTSSFMQPLCNRLETFRLEPALVGKQPNLVQFPPDFQPIPCKPLFFDLALNHVAFPPLDDKVEQKGKGGLTGYIKGIFGFGS